MPFDLGSKGVRCRAYAKRPSDRRRATALSIMRRSLTNLLRASAQRAASKNSQTLNFCEAKYGYRHWGADGKVRQLDQLHPHLRELRPEPGPTRTMSALVEQPDLATVIWEIGRAHV